MLVDETVYLKWWVLAPNFGDLLSPWLINKLTGKKVVYNDGKDNEIKPLLAIGSIAKYATPGSTVWGSGFFGDETKKSICTTAKYLSVRGPLTRNLLRIHKVKCPAIYGDPALLVPFFYSPIREKKYKVGIVLRWSEKNWNEIEFGEGIKKIYLGGDEIEPIIDQFLECEAILSSSLHGLIIADAYGIPSGWLDSTTPKGLNFKFYDYFLSVDKVQSPQPFSPKKKKMDLIDILSTYKFDSRKIKFDAQKLLKAFPLIN